MNKYILLLLLSTSLFSLNSFAMNEEPMEIEQTHSSPVQLSILKDKELYLIPKITTLVENRRTSIKGFGKRSTPQSIDKNFTSKISEIKDDPSLVDLANAVYIASFADDSAEKVNEAYQVFINATLKTDPYKLVILLGYHDIQTQISPEQLQKLSSYKYEKSETLRDYHIRQQDNDSLHRNAFVAAFIYAHEHSIHLDAQACLLMNILKIPSRKGNSFVSSQELLDFVANPSISLVVRVHAYFLTAYYQSALQHMNHGLSLLPKDHEDYGFFLGKRNEQWLSLRTAAQTEDIEELITSLEEESRYQPLDRNKVEFLVSHAEKQGALTKALSYFKGDLRLSSDYVRLLIKAQQYDQAYEALTEIKSSHEGQLPSAYQSAWLMLNWKRKDLVEFDSTLCSFIPYIGFSQSDLRNYINTIADEIMESEISLELKAHFAYVFNGVNPLGFELASQFHHILDPVLRFFISLPLLHANETKVNQKIYDEIRNLLLTNREVILAGLPRLFNDVSKSKGLLEVVKGRVGALCKKYEGTEHMESLRAIYEAVNGPQEAPKPEGVKKKRPLEAPEEKQKDKKRLKPASTEENDPRRNWRYDVERIESGSCNATEEHLAGYKAVFDFIERMIKEGHISEAQAYKAKIVTKGLQILHKHNAEICRELTESPTLKNYSDRYHVQRSRDIILHPENAEASLESRAQNFYNILMAAFEFVRQSNDVNLQVKFVNEAFASHIPCFEARSRAMDQWRESSVQKQLSYLQTPESISRKDAKTNICDIAHYFLERMEFELPEVKSMKRVEALKGILGPQTANGLNKEMMWSLKELQKRIDIELEDHHKQTGTYRNIALELQTLLVGKQASDKVIEASDIDHVLRNVLSWNLPESLEGNKTMETEEI